MQVLVTKREQGREREENKSEDTTHYTTHYTTHTHTQRKIERWQKTGSRYMFCDVLCSQKKINLHSLLYIHNTTKLMTRKCQGKKQSTITLL